MTPGRVTAPVRGTRPRPYRTTVRLRTLTDTQWDTFLDAVTSSPAHIAALLDKDMPQELNRAAQEAGVQLLPGEGELESFCSCPDSGRPCKHAAALCYQTARFLDSDPFVLLLLRGRDEDELLGELTKRNAALTAREAARRAQEHTADQGVAEAEPGRAQEPWTPTGVLARDALATSVRPPLPAPLPPQPTPGVPPPYPDAPPGGNHPDLPGHPGHPGLSGPPDLPWHPELFRAPDPEALAFLATHAAIRAHSALTEPGALAPAPLWHDTVRLAATHPQLARRGTLSTRFAALANAAGRPAQDLMRGAAAWRQGAEEGLAVLEAAWDPPAGHFDRARGALAAADLPRMSPWRNRLTDPARSSQLRYGHDGRWYPYRGVPGAQDEWWPEGRADADPVAALTGMMDG